MAFRPTALRSVMGRLSVPEQETGEIVEIVEDSLDDLATKADIARLEKQIAEMQAWIADKLLLTLGIVLAIAAVAVAVAEAIP